MEAGQRSKAVYLRDELKFDPANNGRLAAGVRRELFDQDARNTAPASAIFSDSLGLNAWDLQASYTVLPSVDAYVKLGQSYRVANADENGYTASGAPLKPQTSHDLELGVSHAYRGYTLAARVFRHQLSNEIFFDPTLNGGNGANTNLDPTKRQGLELDAAAPLAPDWKLSAHYQHVNATFRAGPNSGKQIVLVPNNVLSARLSWIPARGQTADIGAQWVDSQRYGDDFANSCTARIPGYATLDARYARQFGQWEWALAGSNLTDKRYYSQAYTCKGGVQGIYPSDGRQLKLSARYDF
ncbi:TonB-dependent receptor domain-containing protein [Oxalobacteraceae bacterium A2-2]